MTIALLFSASAYARPLSDFGGGCDGSATVAQNDTAFATAFASPAVQIELPACVVSVSQPIVMIEKDAIKGVGKRLSFLRTTSPTNHLIDVSSYYSAISGLTMDASVPRTGGAFVNIRPSAANLELNDFTMERPYIGILANGAAVFSFTNGLIDSPVASVGIGIRVVSGYAMYMNNVLIGCDPAARGKAGIQVESTADFSIEYTQVLACNTNLLVVPSTGQEVDSLNIANSYFDGPGVDSVALTPIGSGLIQRSAFINSWFTPGSGVGVRMTGSIRGQKFIGCRFPPNAGGTGIGLIALSGGIEGLQVSDSSIYNQTNGLYLDGINSAIITANRIGPTDGFGPNGTGIAFNASGHGGRVIVSDNDLSGNTTSIWNAGSVDPSSKIVNNVGY